MEKNEVAEAMEKHRLLVVNHMAVCTQWGAALRQLIISAENKSHEKGEPAEMSHTPGVLPQTYEYTGESGANKVQLLNISAMPSALDGADSLPMASESDFSSNLLATTSSDSTPAQITFNHPAHTKETTAGKTKSRFGRILHL